MANNTTLAVPSGSSAGDIIRDIDRAGIKTQVIQLDHGGAAAESLTSAANPMPVKLTDGTNSVTIADSSAAASETAVDRLKVNSALRLLDITQPAGSQLVAGKGDQTSGLWVNVKASANSSVTLLAGAAIAGKFGIDQTTPGTTNLVSIGASGSVTLLAGTAAFGKLAANAGVTIGAVEIAAAQTVATVTTVSTVTNLAQLGGAAIAMGTGVRSAGTQRVTVATDDVVPVTPPTLTKGTQGSSGFSTQDLKDAGRVIFSAAVVIAGVTTVTTEALLSMVPTRDGVAGAAIATFPVTANKRLRITGVTVGMISTGAAVLSMRFALRMNPSGAATATSPILRIIPLSQQAAALAMAGNEMTVDFPDGIEFSGAHQFGITQIGSAITGTCWASITGFEY